MASGAINGEWRPPRQGRRHVTGRLIGSRARGGQFIRSPLARIFSLDPFQAVANDDPDILALTADLAPKAGDWLGNAANGGLQYAGRRRRAHHNESQSTGDDPADGARIDHSDVFRPLVVSFKCAVHSVRSPDSEACSLARAAPSANRLKMRATGVAASSEARRSLLDGMQMAPS